MDRSMPRSQETFNYCCLLIIKRPNSIKYARVKMQLTGSEYTVQTDVFGFFAKNPRLDKLLFTLRKSVHGTRAIANMAEDETNEGNRKRNSV